MTELDRLPADAVARGDVPFVVAMMADRNGVQWEGSAGRAGDAGPAGPTTLVRLFSMTKAVGSLAALLLVDRGLLRLDTEVVSVLPEFRAVRVLQGLTAAGPIYRAPRRPVTLRHLLTHTSGLSTATYDPGQAAWHEATGAPGVLAGTRASMFYPLRFDPGECFAYGIGVDWAGRMVEAVDGRTIDRFCREEILEPLGMTDTVFEPERRLAPLVSRTDHGGFRPAQLAPPARPEVYGMGAALYGTARDHLRFLRLVLGRGELDGRRLLSTATADLMTAGLIGDLEVPVLRSTSPDISADVDLYPGNRTSWTAGFQRVEYDVPGGRRAGSVGWAGIANTHCWVDPAAGVAAVFVTQLLPFCDPRCLAVVRAFERAVHRRVGSVPDPAIASAALHRGTPAMRACDSPASTTRSWPLR